jgi:hypothetical protein
LVGHPGGQLPDGGEFFGLPHPFLHLLPFLLGFFQISHHPVEGGGQVGHLFIILGVQVDIEPPVPIHHVLEKGAHPFERDHRHSVVEIVEDGKQGGHTQDPEQEEGKGHFPQPPEGVTHRGSDRLQADHLAHFPMAPVHLPVMAGDGGGRSGRVSVAEQALLLHDHSLDMKKVFLSVPGHQAFPSVLRAGLLSETVDKALFKDIGLVLRVHGVNGHPPVNVAGKLLGKPLHDAPVHKGAGHDLADEEVSGHNLEDLGPKLVPGILHGRIDVSQHDIRLLISLPDIHLLEIIIGKEGEDRDAGEQDDAQSQHEFCRKSKSALLHHSTLKNHIRPYPGA